MFMVIFQFAMLVITRGDISWLPWDHDFQSDQPMNRAPHPSARRIRRLSSDLASEASWALEVSPNKWGMSKDVHFGEHEKIWKMARYGKIWEDHPFFFSLSNLNSTQQAWCFLGDLHTCGTFLNEAVHGDGSPIWDTFGQRTVSRCEKA